MAAEGRHRRRHSSATTRRLILVAGVTGAGLGVPATLAGSSGAAATHSRDPGPDTAADAGRSAVPVAFTGTVQPTGPAKPASPTVHVVAPGETLSGIARSRRTPGGWRSVYLDNREVIGADPDRILPGQRLHLTAATPTAQRAALATEHLVRRGETLGSIAEHEDVDGGWRSVYLDNREVIGADPDRILPGQRLVLPAPGRGPARVPAKARPAKASAARHPAAASHTAPATLPVKGYTLTAGYAASGSHWTHRHTGQDFAVPMGTPVVGVLAGTVVSAGWDGAYGNDVILHHQDGTYTLYAHLSSIAVRSGQTVTAGRQLGRSGATGNVTGPHLHFEVRRTPGYGSDVDPGPWLRKHGLHP